jgi:hypothetical protein
MIRAKMQAACRLGRHAAARDGEDLASDTPSVPQIGGKRAFSVPLTLGRA